MTRLAGLIDGLDAAVSAGAVLDANVTGFAIDNR